MSESQFILKSFIKAFDGKQRVPMAFYGVGQNTKFLLEHIKGYKIVGLLDVQNTGKIIYGFPVLSEEETLKSVKIIIVVARNAVQKIIYERIKHMELNGIAIMNVQGENLSDKYKKQRFVEDIPYWNASYEELKNEIDNHDVISFDIYDTLLMRKTLFPRDIFSIVEMELLKEKPGISFKNIRYEAEMQLNSSGTTFAWKDIYTIIQKKNPMLSAELASKIMQIEWDMEKRMTICREDMRELLIYGRRKGKKIFLLSDMYYGRNQLAELLSINGIGEELYDDLLVSADCGQTKWSGKLFEVLKRIVGKSATILHIGDNEKSDYYNAKEHGLDAYLIFSSYEMLLRSSVSHILAYTENISDHLTIGLFSSRAFNSPFALHDTRGILQIHNREEIGYLCFGPIINSFMRWFMKQMRSYGEEDKILFSARDGWLFYQIYKSIRTMSHPEAEYFLISRRAISVASIEKEEDVLKIYQKSNSSPEPLTVTEYLANKYGLRIFDEKENQQKISYADRNMEKVLKKYHLQILQNAESERKNYNEYLKKLDLHKINNVILFDLVSAGSIPYYLKKLLIKENYNCEMVPVCFATANLPNDILKDEREIISFWGNEFFYQPKTKVFQYYQLLESVLTAPFPQLIQFDDKGDAIYSSKGYDEGVFAKVKEVQRGILRYGEEWSSLDLLEATVNRELLDAMFSVFEKNMAVVNEEVKEAFYIESASENIPLHPIWDELVQ